MTKSPTDLGTVVSAALTPEERANGVAYLAVSAEPFPTGTRLEFPGVVIEMAEASYLIFIDRQPMANWGHPARYLVVNGATAKTRSIESRLPPFRSDGDLRWRVIYQAPSIPDGAVAPTK